MRQIISGSWEPDPSGTPLPIDWAAFVTEALAGAAANIGGTTQILAGRPGSWEAAKVREILESTVGADDESLWDHRTEPITVSLWVENILLDLDDPTLEQHDATLAELYDRQDAIPAPDDVDTTPAFDWLTDPDWINDPEKVATVEKLQAELAAHPPTPGQQTEQAAVDAITELCDRLETQHHQELSTYAHNLAAAIAEHLEQLHLGVPIDITITTAPAGADLRHGTTPLLGGASNPIDGAIAAAIAATPTPANLPGTPLARLESTAP